MKIDVFLMGDRTGTYFDMGDQVREAEDLGYHGVWLAERHLVNGDLLWPSPMVVAAYFAARTRRIRIGLAARILPFHHPLQVAEDAITLDVISEGRFDLGLSSGSMDDGSHLAFGVSREEARSRFEEAFRVLRLACAGETFSFEGRHYQLSDVTPAPRPVQRPHPPFYMVANRPGALDWAGGEGLPVFLHGALDVEAAYESVSRYRAAAERVGRDPRESDLLLNRFVLVAETDAEARRIARGPFLEFLEQRAPDLRAYLARTFGDRGLDFDFLAEHVCVFGSPETCAARIAEMRQRTGIQHVLCTFNLITLPHHVCLSSMRRFAREVMPRLGRAAPEAGARNVAFSSTEITAEAMGS